MKQRPLPTLKDAGDLTSRYVFLRASLDVPIQDGAVTNTFRIERALPTIRFLTERGARVILATHVGRDPKETVEPLYAALKAELSISYVPEVVGQKVQAARDVLKDGEVLLIENLRAHEGETKNDAVLSQELASYADLYVGDAFAVAHRAHVSIVGVPAHLPSYAGLNFAEEYERLGAALTPAHPALFMLGGAKFETKQPLVQKYLDTYDHVFIGGALANDFFKAKGYEVGTSVVSDTLPEAALLTCENLLIPVDVVVTGPSGTRTTTPDDVHKDEMIVDAGPATASLLAPYITSAATILWNGPVGFYEKGYVECTQAIAKRVAESSATSILGGGDTIAAIEPLQLEDQFSFVSTAGGAMLTFLEAETLPGIEALMKHGN